MDMVAMANALRTWTRVVGVGDSVGAEAAAAMVVGGVAAGAEAAEEARALAREAMVTHQQEVAMLVGSLRCVAIKGLLRRDACRDECAMQRTLRAWRQAVGGEGSRAVAGGRGEDAAYLEGMEV